MINITFEYIKKPSIIILKQIASIIYLIIHRETSPKSSELNHRPINRRIIPCSTRQTVNRERGFIRSRLIMQGQKVECH